MEWNAAGGPHRLGWGWDPPEPDPWDEVEHRYPVGSVARGEVSGLSRHAAFVSLEPGVQGKILLKKQLPKRRGQNRRYLLRTGETVELRIGAPIETVVEAIDEEIRLVLLRPAGSNLEPLASPDRGRSTVC